MIYKSDKISLYTQIILIISDSPSI